MKRRRKLYRIDEYCKKNGFENYEFFNELNKHPDRAENLRTDPKGDYIIDEESLKFIGDMLCIKKERNRKKYMVKRHETPSAAVAAEINFLVSENERLRKELEMVYNENKRLRTSAEYRETARAKYRRSDKSKK